MTNVETLANVPLILTRGADWYRTIGTRETPGPLICTVVGDVVHAGFAEIEPGTTLREVIDRVGGGVRGRSTGEGGVVGRVESRARRRGPRRAGQLRRALAAAGGGLGSAGFIVYDDTRSMVAVARMVSRFLYVESCGQCRACKFGCGEITRHLDELADAHGDVARHRVDRRAPARHHRPEPLLPRRGGAARRSRACCARSPRTSRPSSKARRRSSALPVPKIVDIRDGVATYDEKQMRKQPDWTYSTSHVKSVGRERPEDFARVGPVARLDRELEPWRS